MTTSWKAHPESLGRYRPADGRKALLLYLLLMGLLLLQGYASTTQLSVSILESLQVLVPLAGLLLTLVWVKGSRQPLSSLGFVRAQLGRSLLLGLGLALGLLAVLLGVLVWFQQKSVQMHWEVSLPSLVLLFIGALEEEAVFRGYLGTRLSSLWKNPLLCSGVTGLLFLLIHYPVFWFPVGGITFSALDSVHVLMILLLHAVCDFVYRRTHCLWGSVALHFLYNLGSSLFLLS